MAEQLWHDQPEIKTLLQNFHRKYARYPTSRIKKAKKRFKVYTNYLEDNLRAQGMCSRIEYTGSVYQGVVVPYTNMDFDIVVIQPPDISRNLTPVYRSPGYYSLKTADEKAGLLMDPNLLDDKGFLLPVESLDNFFGILQQIINNHGEMSEVTKLRRSGPSVQMDTCRMNRSGIVMYSVDVVLGYEILVGGQKCVFVAKPPKTPGPQTSKAWRKSSSLEEKALFHGMDRDGGCRKMVLRILKIMLKRQTELEGLTSYNLKTALLHEVRNVSSWKQSKLVPRLIAVLHRLCRSLEDKTQSDYFVPDTNLLAKLSSAAMTAMGNRLRAITDNKDDFINAFT